MVSGSKRYLREDLPKMIPAIAGFAKLAIRISRLWGLL
jgi:hypothetical protein